MVKIRYFAWVREKMGVDEENVALPDHVKTIEQLMIWQRERGETAAAAFENSDLLKAAIDQIHCEHDAPLEGAREIAFFPPMTGG